MMKFSPAAILIFIFPEILMGQSTSTSSVCFSKHQSWQEGCLYFTEQQSFWIQPYLHNLDSCESIHDEAMSFIEAYSGKLPISFFQ
jgi:hypothetical protein